MRFIATHIQTPHSLAYSQIVASESYHHHHQPERLRFGATTLIHTCAHHTIEFTQIIDKSGNSQKWKEQKNKKTNFTIKTQRKRKEDRHRKKHIAQN